MKRLVLGWVWLAAAVVAHAGGAQAPKLEASSTARVVLATLEDPDAAGSTVWEVTSEKAVTRAQVAHAPGMAPWGVWDHAHEVLWLVVADAPSRNGQPARLVRMDAAGALSTVLHGVQWQRPRLSADGTLWVTTVQDARFALWRVTPAGLPTRLFDVEGTFVTPAGPGTQGKGCVAVQDGNTAQVRCGAAGASQVVQTQTGMLRDVTAVDGGFAAVRVGRSGWEVARWSGNAWTVLATLPGPVDAVFGARVLLANGGAGQGLWRHDNGKEAFLGAQGGERTVPLVLSRTLDLAVVRLDSVDSIGAVDGRAPSRFRVVDTGTGAGWRLKTQGRLTQIYGVAGAGVRP